MTYAIANFHEAAYDDERHPASRRAGRSRLS